MAGTLDLNYLFTIPGILNLAEIVRQISFSFLSSPRLYTYIKTKTNRLDSLD